MFPETQDLTVVTVEETAVTGKSFLFDFTTGDFIVQNGKLVECDGTEAIKVWIEKILRTEKDRFEVYADIKYGCRLEDLLIGSSYPTAFIESEMRREIEDALLQNSSIASISGFSIERAEGSTNVTFTVTLTDDTTVESAVSL
jgi:phage baseplate assembly protein W